MHWIVSKPPHRGCVSNGPYNPVSMAPRGAPRQIPWEILKETPKETPKEAPTQNETVMTYAKRP